jgi:magnesium-transporting ATPase (P-type)
MEADQCINKRTAKVYRGSTYYENMEWGSIQQGDIIYLCQGEAAPADIILLDSQQIEHR